MKNSLRDQLLNSGLANKKQLNKLTQQQRQASNLQKKARKSGKKIAQKTLAPDLILQAQQEKKQRDKDLNRLKEHNKQEKALIIEMNQLIASNIQTPPKDADIPFNFSYQNQIKRIYVNSNFREKIIAGQLLIALFDNGFILIPAEIANRIRPKAPNRLIELGDTNDSNDDDYAEYIVPDDLIW